MAPHPALALTDHRPWPLPSGPWRWRQSWQDLLFAHWPVPVARLRPLLPPDLHPQTFDGTAWVGVVPFRMAGVAPRPLPDVPHFSTFPELNVRLYVERDGKPGVWFLSLDAASRTAVFVGRRFYHVPYYLAHARLSATGTEIAFHSVRRGKTAVFAARYAPLSPPAPARPGSLEHFLTERYCLYARAPDGAITRTDVHHEPWPLQTAVADISANTALDAADLPLDGPPPLLHFARGVDVVVWPPQRTNPP